MGKFLTLAVFLSVICHMFVFEQGLGGDGWGYYAIVESVVFDGDLDLNNNVYGVYNGFKKSSDGRWITQYPPGLAIMDAPFVLLSQVLFGSIVIPREAVDSHHVYKNVPNIVLIRSMGVVLAHNFYTLLGLVLLFLLLLKSGFSDYIASGLVFVGYFSSPLHFYAQSGMSHADSFFMLVLLLYLFEKYLDRHGSRQLFLIGMISGLASAVRLPNVMIFFVVLVFLFFLDGRIGKIKSVSLLSLGFLSVVWVVPVFYLIHSGSFYPGYSSGLEFNRLPALNILFSLRRGFFWFYPVFLLVFPGIFLHLKHSDRKTKIVGFFAGSCLAVMVVLYGYFSEWFNPGSYTQRYLTGAVPFFIFCMAPCFKMKGKSFVIVLLFTVFTLLYSYSLFLLSISRKLNFPNGEAWALYITDFLYYFKQNLTIKDIFDGIKENLLFLKQMS